MLYKPFREQRSFHRSRDRIRGCFAGKRGGKTESGAVESIIFTEKQIGYRPNGIDPYLGAIIAPTHDMLERLSLKKFFAYAKPFDYRHRQKPREVYWPNGSEIYGISAEKPERVEGIKANWVWVDEVFQIKEQLFLECIARLADNEGYLWVTGSLGTQYTNPKNHWVYKYFKQNPIDGSHYWEWPTSANPYFPKEELQRLKDTLDPRTFRQMFEIDWNVPGTALVYDDLDEANYIKGYQYDSRLPTYVSIDWGWAHPMAALFFQYDPRKDTVVLFDEIVSSRMTIDQLWERIKTKGYHITEWICDIAGNQEREQTGISNVRWFSQSPRNIRFKHRRTAITKGIPIVRSYIKNGLGQRKFFIDEVRCPKSIDQLRNYSYPERDGVIQNENPIKKDDDCCDSIRYYFVNMHDKQLNEKKVIEFDRWGEQWKF